MSQLDLAKKLNISQQAVGSWETNRTTPSLEIILETSTIFDVTTDELLGKKDKPSPRKNELMNRIYLTGQKIVFPGII